MWEWASSLVPGEPAQSRVEIWPRGGAKSSTAELLCALLACTLQRRFVLYVCGTQDQADLHVQVIASLLERMGVPRAVNAYSASVNWTAQRLQTAHGFGVIGVGLNARVRGARLEEYRPDLIILDDVDGEHDSTTATAKKLATITKAILPAGATYATALFVQNKIHANSAVAQVADGRAEVLLGASVCLEPAVRGLTYEQVIEDGKPHYRVTGGHPTWPEGQGLEVAEKQINDWGPGAFLQESQHEDAPEGGLWKADRDIEPWRVALADCPREFVAIATGVDPSGSKGTEAGIVTCGKTADKHYWLLADDSLAGTTEEWVRAAVGRYRSLEGNAIAAERNFGGDMVRAVIQQGDDSVNVELVNASRGKAIRAEPVQQLCQQGRVHFVGHFPDLERELCTWQPGQKSPNRLDAFAWSVHWLMDAIATVQSPMVELEPDAGLLFAQGQGGSPF